MKWLIALALLLGLSQVSRAQYTNCESNAGLGNLVLENCTSAYFEVGIGNESLFNDYTGMGNTGVGAFALWGAGGTSPSPDFSGTENSIVGYKGMYNAQTASYNVGVGAYTLYANQINNGNTGLGYASLYNNIGNYNVAVGTYAGYYATASTNSIWIGNRGTATDNGVIRIGNAGQQRATYIAGIYGTTVSGGYEVVVNSAGQLGYSKTVVQAPAKALTEADVVRIVRRELALAKAAK